MASIKVRAILVLVLFLTSCDPNSTLIDIDTAVSPQEIQGSKITTVEGRLVFVDMMAFSSFMKDLIESGSTPFEEMEVADDFVSLYASTRELQEENYETTGGANTWDNSYFEIVEDPFFAKVLNESGEIQIGINVFKITRNYVYQAIESNVGSIKDINLRNADQTAFVGKHSGIRGVSAHKIERTTSHAEFGFTAKAMADASCTAEFRKRRRIQGWSWITDFRVYQSAGVGTKAQKRSWFRWRSVSVEEVSLDATFTLVNSLTTYTGDTRRTDTSSQSEVVTVLMYDYGSRGFISGNISANHSGRRDGEQGSIQNASCSTRIND